MPRTSSAPKRKCFISDELKDKEKNSVRKKVCINLSVEHEHNNQYYCVLHLPHDLKHENTNFNTVLKARLKKQMNEFSYVFFPNEIELTEHNFTNSVDFTNAVFNSYVNFSKAIFIKDSNFNNVTFNQNVDFNNAAFSRGTKYYQGAYFRNTTFKREADFNNATFYRSADFNSATFAQVVNFNYTTFSRVPIFTHEISFRNAVFIQGANFNRAIFGMDVDFSKAVFDENSHVFFQYTEFYRKVIFEYCTFRGYLAFKGYRQDKISLLEVGGLPSLLFVGQKVELDLQNARIENPERISFHSVRLQPNWFINVDARKFVFIDCIWRAKYKRVYKKVNVKSEIICLDTRNINRPSALLTKACRQLADNYEENNGFEEASMFRQMAMESQRRGSYLGFKVWNLHWWYWRSSLYGESWWQANLILLLILLGFALIYTRTTFQNCPKDMPVSISLAECVNNPERCKCQTGGLVPDEAIRHSLSTATFQNTDYRKPITEWGETFIILEKIFAPLQAALLALAIRRKFMR